MIYFPCLLSFASCLKASHSSNLSRNITRFLNSLYDFTSHIYICELIWDNILGKEQDFFPMAGSCPSWIKFLIDVDNKEVATQTKETTEMEAVHQRSTQSPVWF